MNDVCIAFGYLAAEHVKTEPLERRGTQERVLTRRHKHSVFWCSTANAAVKTAVMMAVDFMTKGKVIFIAVAFLWIT